MDLLQNARKKAAGLMSHLDPANQQTPVLGPLRKFNADTFGTQPYADPNLPARERVNAGLDAFGSTFMGAHGAPTRPSLPVKDGLVQALDNQPGIVDALKRFDTTLGDTSRRSGVPEMDLDLYPNLVKYWQHIYGANKSAPSDIASIAEEVRDGLRAAMSKAKKGELDPRQAFGNARAAMGRLMGGER